MPSALVWSFNTHPLLTEMGIGHQWRGSSQSDHALWACSFLFIHSSKETSYFLISSVGYISQRFLFLWSGFSGCLVDFTQESQLLKRIIWSCHSFLLKSLQTLSSALRTHAYIISPPLYWDIIDILHCISLKYAMWWFDTQNDYQLIPSITSHNYFLCIWWEHLRSTLTSTSKYTIQNC